MNLMSKILTAALAMFAVACNETANTPKTEVFKTQTDALEKAKQVELTLQDSAQQQRDEVTKQAQ